MPSPTLDIVVGRLNALHSSDELTWREIAALKPYRGIPAGTLSAIAGGRIPKKPEHRARLGLPEVVVMGHTQICAKSDCDREFVSNHPRRKYCPICSPPKV